MRERLKAILEEKKLNPELHKLEAHKYFAEFLPVIEAALEPKEEPKPVFKDKKHK
jgi:hypothetical protein